MSSRKHNYLFKQAIKIAKNYIHHEDVNDIFFGPKLVKGKYTEDLSIRFNVNKKLSKSKLKAHRILPKKLGKFQTDVTDFKIQKHVYKADPYLTIRPLIGGLQIQSELFNDGSSWGTLGLITKINQVMYGITNYHVCFGEGGSPKPNSLIYQCSKANFGEVIGSASSVFDQDLDYCLIKLSAQKNLNQDINEIGGFVEGYCLPTSDLKLFKSGTNTGLTFGVFDSRSIVNPSKITIRFDLYSPNESPLIANRGDSGSMWVTRVGATPGNLRMFALHTGGDTTNNIAFATLFSSIQASIRQKLPAI